MRVNSHTGRTHFRNSPKDNMTNLKTFALCFLMALALLAPATFAQSYGYDVPTLPGFLVAQDGRLVFTDTVDGKVQKVPYGYRAWAYSGNPLTSQALDPDGHERVINLMRKATYGEKAVNVKWVTAPGWAGGFMVFVGDTAVINALQVAHGGHWPPDGLDARRRPQVRNQ
jgi:hypothetical protein